ncbi:peroxiredoxin 1 [Nematocida sp. LUAm3]|nr:peroxiredoxin 1 [Nematocida sp. LUAm3]KAI5173881.1 peroxiredoxin 1 [Nematocida sp. LUAm2]KAI5177374.1 peroxiredoxin 1 [Nematocida sp. LUAm1]
MSIISHSVMQQEIQVYLPGPNEEFKRLSLEEYSDKLIVLVFYPLDFTFVCPTEILGYSEERSKLEEENAKLFLVSCDSVYAHKAWSHMKGGIEENTLPMLSDPTGSLCKALGVYNEQEGRPKRATVILDSQKVVYHLTHSDPIGRSTQELLRVLKAINFNKKHGAICPLNWEE